MFRTFISVALVLSCTAMRDRRVGAVFICAKQVLTLNVLEAFSAWEGQTMALGSAANLMISTCAIPVVAN